MRGTRWGNPYRLKEQRGRYSREESMELYERDLEATLRKDPGFLEDLRGYNLGCTCAPDVLCHADILLRHLYDAPSVRVRRKA